MRERRNGRDRYAVGGPQTNQVILLGIIIAVSLRGSLNMLDCIRRMGVNPYASEMLSCT